jgi:hypothetical protein
MESKEVKGKGKKQTSRKKQNKETKFQSYKQGETVY